MANSIKKLYSIWWEKDYRLENDFEGIGNVIIHKSHKEIKHRAKLELDVQDESVESLNFVFCAISGGRIVRKMGFLLQADLIKQQTSKNLVLFETPPPLLISIISLTVTVNVHVDEIIDKISQV